MEEEQKHVSRTGTFSYKMECEVTQEGANKFLEKVLTEKGTNIYRIKGFFAIEGSSKKFVFHGVGMLIKAVSLDQANQILEWKPDEKRVCAFVIIGKNLEQKWLEDQFKAAALSAAVDDIENLAENLESLKIEQAKLLKHLAS